MRSIGVGPLYNSGVTVLEGALSSLLMSICGGFHVFLVSSSELGSECDVSLGYSYGGCSEQDISLGTCELQKSDYSVAGVTGSTLFLLGYYSDSEVFPVSCEVLENNLCTAESRP